MDAQNYIRCVCEGCNTEFEAARQKRYCTRRCNKAHLKKIGSRQSRAEYLSAARSRAVEYSKHYFNCAHCGVLAYRKLGGNNVSKGYANKYCAMSCRVAAAEKLNTEIDFLAGLARRNKTADRTAMAFRSGIRSLVASLSGIAKRRGYAQRPCRVCGEHVGYARMGIPRTYCSRECQKKTVDAIAARRAHRAKRKALKRGANGGEAVNPIAVFASAGWKCQICSKPTPQRLRGTTHKRAPELDHIVPVSKGGKHTWANTQCVCRECNQWKSDRVVVGQIGLFTGLV